MPIVFLIPRRSLDPHGMRYYVYVSDRKLDMLYEQIPLKLRSRLVSELRLDIRVVSVSIRDRDPEATRYGKLAVVERYIERHLDVGSVTEHAPWFRGRLPLQCGIYRNVPGGLLYYWGKQDDVLLALIGSPQHLLAPALPLSDVPVSYSTVSALFKVLRSAEAPEAASTTSYRARDQDALQEVVDFADSLEGVPEPSEFLARRLLFGPIEEERPERYVVLGTPLYVALEDA